ncbi:heavy-metal-associated domain-containing protein [Inquilinus sp. KBS0705]|nr:heavy-metal-associated domain-containing protein [Inquilinus sp. KBS0705]
MTHTYKISGMTCKGCQGKVEKILHAIPGIKGVEIDLPAGTAHITMTAHVSIDTLKAAFRDYPRYEINENIPQPISVMDEAAGRSWFETYKPVILIFIYITAISVLLSVEQEHFKLLKAMRIFMSGFFLTFSFFKLLDLRGFADSYRMYDLLARKFPVWGYLYAVLELLLGITFAVNFLPVLSNWVSLVVLSVSVAGVLKSVLNKHAIKCACLGSVFNLPMSTLTIFEDALMITMSALMLFLM